MTIVDTAIETQNAVFSGDRLYRYFLKRDCLELCNSPSCNALLKDEICLWAGANPSVAGAATNDLTITKEMEWTRRFHYRWMQKVNLQAAVSTDPNGLIEFRDPVGPENYIWIEACLRQPKLGMIVCAYGDLGKNYAAKFEQMLRDIKPTVPIMCFGLTKAGYPKHTSRLAYDTPLVPYEALH